MKHSLDRKALQLILVHSSVSNHRRHDSRIRLFRNPSLASFLLQNGISIPFCAMKQSYRHHDEMAGSHHAAERIVPCILGVTGGLRSVVDVGGGDGGWLRVFQQHGVKHIRLYDSADVEPVLQIDRCFFQPIDLKSSLPDPGRYDLALCLEFAEHLPLHRARALVEWLTRVSDIIVFSAAIPGQGGKGHINEQPPEYWTGLFGEYGFVRSDILRPMILHDLTIPWWYRQNLVLFLCPDALVGEHKASFLPEEFFLIHHSAFNRLAKPDLRILLPRLVPSVGITLNKVVKKLVRWGSRKFL